MSEETVDCGLHDAQSDFLLAPQRVKVGCFGRGWGKSYEIGAEIYNRMCQMPRSKGFVSAGSFEQIENTTIAECRKFWEVLGLYEGVHYVVNKKPPHYWKGFKECYSPPTQYKHSIVWLNGCTVMFLSVEKIDLRRGGSYDWGVIDEALNMKEEQFKKVIRQMLRGNEGIFPVEIHHALTIFTSRPRKAEAMWIYRYRELHQQEPEKYLWKEGPGIENPMRTAEWIKEQEEELGYLEFLIEVMNEEITRLPDGFYPDFNRDRHVYQPSYHKDDRGELISSDYDPNALIDLSFDFGGWFSCCAAFQNRNNTEYLIHQFYVKEEKKVAALVTAFCDKYEGHRHKFVRLWGEPMGVSKNHLTPLDTFATMSDYFKVRGWSVQICATSAAAKQHRDRFIFMGDLLTETKHNLPKLRINGTTAKDVIIAFELCDINEDFQKAKAIERNRKSPQEHAPHFTDLADNYFVQKHGAKSLRNKRAGRAYTPSTYNNR
jgi:hypothetical protein